MTAIFSSFISYFVILIVLAAISVAGIFVGKALRDKSDAKKENENKNKNQN